MRGLFQAEPFEMLSKEQIVTRLKKYDRPDIVEVYGEIPCPKAAILVPLFFRDAELRVLLTVRSPKLRSHGGEVACPGGKKDSTDATLLDTALRESWEEIGLPREEVEVVAQGVPFFTKSKIVVTPFIGFIEDNFVPIANESEVDAVFSMPLMEFLSKDNHTCQKFEGHEGPSYIHFFSHTENGRTYRPWGITALTCIVIANIIYGKAPEYPMNYEYDSNEPNKLGLTWYKRIVSMYNTTQLENSKL
ncbi:peroxisomal coenzyme A diphosphatase NUDT7-like [Ptychodera flava]|uniref:peroxisomal coenzyme A diphosphatase NUDT7-like n=1 Tax=Ptychodera flava TaxID=63121 RepID=UPI003969E69C